MLFRSFPTLALTDRRLPVVSRGLLKRLVQFEFNLGGLKGALGLHAYEPLVVHTHYKVGLGPVSYLTGGETHT